MTGFADQLRAWARENYSTEAGTELLVRAFAGRLARPGYRWIRDDPRPWIEFDAIADSATAVYSGGERRVLAIAASLGGDRLVNLSEVLTGLDAATLQLMIDAVAHAGDGRAFVIVVAGPTGERPSPSSNHSQSGRVCSVMSQDHSKFVT